jgi:uncharacterized phage-associated protein
MLHNRKLEELIVLLGRHPKVTNLGYTKLWKLIYFIDSKALRDLGASVTGSEFIKYQHGPVPSRGEKHLGQLVRSGQLQATQRQVGSHTLTEVTSLREADASAFSSAEVEVIETVCAEFGRKSAAALSALSHQEPSWHYAELMGKLSTELMAYGRTEDPVGL